MNIPKPKTPATGATKWIAALLGRMDKHLAQVIPALAAAMTPKLPKCIPLHKRAGYVKREHVNKNGRPTKGSRKKAVASARRAANATQPHLVEPRQRKPHDFRVSPAGHSYTLVGSRQPETGLRRVWSAGVSSTSGEFA